MTDAGVDRVAPTSQGTYALFDLPDGSILLVYRPAGSEEDQRMQFPAAMVTLAKKAAAGEGIIPGPIGKMMHRSLAKRTQKQNP